MQAQDHKTSLNPRQIDAKLTEFEGKIEELDRAYEQYFIGIERRPPNLLSKEVERLRYDLTNKTFIQQTAQQFRLRAISQRYNTYKTKWDRIMRQIEEGTYVRDLKRAKRREDRRASREVEQERFDALEIDLEAIDDLDVFARELDGMAAAGAFSGGVYAPGAVNPSGGVYAPGAVSAQPAAPAGVYAPGAVQATPQRPQQPPQRPQQPQPAYAQPPQPSYSQPPQRPATPPQRPAPAAAAPPAQESAASRRDKLERMKQRLEQRQQPTTPAAPTTTTPREVSAPSRSIDRASGGHRSISRDQARAAASSAASPPNRVIQRGGGSSQEDEARQVYRNLVAAKRRCNEPTDGLSYESVARSMREQREQLQQQRGSQNVDFKVVIRDGKAHLKPEES